MGIYNHATTGEALLMPYSLNHRVYWPLPFFVGKRKIRLRGWMTRYSSSSFSRRRRATSTAKQSHSSEWRAWNCAEFLKTGYST